MFNSKRAGMYNKPGCSGGYLMFMVKLKIGEVMLQKRG
jgi:hypothetical protein